MLRYVVPSGVLCYGSETVDQADARQRRMLVHNRRLDRVLRKNGRPMPAMRQWALSRGIKQVADAFRS